MGSREAWSKKYQYQRFGLRNTVERFFGYLKQRTRRFKSLEDYPSAIAILRNLTIMIKNPSRSIT